ncbi:MAG: hypothetical protein JST85_18025 [Acidobacteria bacterium]|nr:hypothetical protein [Acidobacteriota bacterium]
MWSKLINQTTRVSDPIGATFVRTLPSTEENHSARATVVRLAVAQRAEKLTEEERLLRQTVLDTSPLVGQGVELVESFREAICSRSEDKLAAWMVAGVFESGTGNQFIP